MDLGRELWAGSHTGGFVHATIQALIGEVSSSEARAAIVSRTRYDPVKKDSRPIFCAGESPGQRTPGDGASAFRRSSEGESRGHFYEVGERVGLHLFHHLAPVCLYRDLTDVEFAPDLLIQ